MKRKREEHELRNAEAASIIVMNPSKFGGEDAGLVQWVRSFRETHR